MTVVCERFSVNILEYPEVPRGIEHKNKKKKKETVLGMSGSQSKQMSRNDLGYFRLSGTGSGVAYRLGRLVAQVYNCLVAK